MNFNISDPFAAPLAAPIADADFDKPVASIIAFPALRLAIQARRRQLRQSRIAGAQFAAIGIGFLGAGAYGMNLVHGPGQLPAASLPPVAVTTLLCAINGAVLLYRGLCRILATPQSR